jgi:hypothetical protein
MTTSICEVLYEQSFAWFDLPPAVPSPVQRLGDEPRSAGLDFSDKPGVALSAANAGPWPFWSVSASSFSFQVHVRFPDSPVPTHRLAARSDLGGRSAGTLGADHPCLHIGTTEPDFQFPADEFSLPIAWRCHSPAKVAVALNSAASLFKRSCRFTYFSVGSLIGFRAGGLAQLKVTTCSPGNGSRGSRIRIWFMFSFCSSRVGQSTPQDTRHRSCLCCLFASARRAEDRPRTARTRDRPTSISDRRYDRPEWPTPAVATSRTKL